MNIEYDVRKMQCVITISQNELNKAFSHYDNYLTLIKELSEMINDFGKGRRI